MIVNFEISNAQYKKIKAYANLFCMTKNSFMTLLVSLGIKEYQENNLVNIKKVVIAAEAKKNLKELNEQVEAKRISMKYVSDEVELKKLQDGLKYLRELISDENKKKKALSTRCKITLSDKINKEVSIILNEQHQKNKKLCKGDIICSLMNIGLEKRYKYLEKYAPYELKVRDRRDEKEKYPTSSTIQYSIEKAVSENKYERKKHVIEYVTEIIPEYVPLNEESYWRDNEKKKISFEISTVFLDFLEERAEQYGIAPDDYIKLLIEQDFKRNVYDT